MSVCVYHSKCHVLCVCVCVCVCVREREQVEVEEREGGVVFGSYFTGTSSLIDVSRGLLSAPSASCLRKSAHTHVLCEEHTHTHTQPHTPSLSLSYTHTHTHKHSMTNRRIISAHEVLKGRALKGAHTCAVFEPPEGHLCRLAACALGLFSVKEQLPGRHTAALSSPHRLSEEHLCTYYASAWKKIPTTTL